MGSEAVWRAVVGLGWNWPLVALAPYLVACFLSLVRYEIRYFATEKTPELRCISARVCQADDEEQMRNFAVAREVPKSALRHHCSLLAALVVFMIQIRDEAVDRNDSNGAGLYNEKLQVDESPCSGRVVAEGAEWRFAQKSPSLNFEL